MAERPSRVLLDTHALVWWKAGSERLSRRARSVIAEATELHVSPVSFWEMAMLVAKGRVALDRPTMTWVNDLVADERIRVVDLTPTVAVAAGELRDFHGDPADRMIVASAQARGLPVVTKDEAIRRSVTAVGGLAVIW